MNNEVKKEKKSFLIVEIVIGALFLAFLLMSIIVQLVDGEGEISLWMKEYVFNVDTAIISLKEQMPTMIRSLILIIAIYAICKVFRVVLRKQMNKSNRAKTVITLVDGFVKYACAIAILICFMKAVGVNTTALFASVGVLTLIVGLGAQTLIADIIAGMFIIFENEYNVGEIITIDDFRGTVLDIGIRSTKLLDAAGNIKIINNSNIANVVNLSRELSVAVVDCEFPYDVPLEYIEKLIEENLEKFKNTIPSIVDGPFYKGVSYYGPSNVAIKIIAQCQETDRFQVQRALMREYRQLLVQEGIDISYTRVVISNQPLNEITVDEKMKKEAKEFVDEQAELSKDLDEQEKQ